MAHDNPLSVDRIKRAVKKVNEVIQSEECTDEKLAEAIASLVLSQADLDLHSAVKSGRMAGVMEDLNKNEADINSQDGTGNTVLHNLIFGCDLSMHMSVSDRIKIMKELIDRGADVNRTDDNRVSPLMAAIAWWEAFGEELEDAVDLLLAAGADPEALDATGEPVLVYAKGNDAITAKIERAILEKQKGQNGCKAFDEGIGL